MSGYRVLVVEDDPLVSAHLESIITRTVDADVVVSASAAEAGMALETPVDFACLDVDVLDGNTYDLAAALHAKGIPFAFISASRRDLVPDALKSAPFIAKPYLDGEIESLLARTGPLRRTGGGTV